MKIKRIYQIPFILIVAIGLLTACSLPSLSKKIEFIVNGVELGELPGADIRNGKLMVAPSFIEEVFDMKAEWSESDTPVYYSDQVAVLMYHDIAKQTSSSGTIQVEKFERQMELLAANGFNVIHIDEYVDYLLHDGSVPDNAVLLTFDDGYETFYEQAFPILKEYDYPAVNFVIVSGIDDPARQGRPKMTWEQMREMQEFGMSFYSHTYDLHHYGVINEEGEEKPVTTRKLYIEAENRTETEEEYTERVKNDLSLAENRLREELGNTRGIIAFPYGAYNDEVLDIIHSLGIEASFTIKEGLNSKEDKNSYRINGEFGETAEEFIEKLKELNPNPRKPLEKDMKNLIIDGQPVHFTDLQPSADGEELMIPLREFCQIYHIKIEWDNKKKLARLTYMANTQ